MFNCNVQKGFFCTYIFYQIPFVFFGTVVLFQPLKKLKKQFFSARRKRQQ